jgi:hypothetical protein
MNDINPHNFGRLTAKVEMLEEQVAEMRSDLRAVRDMLNEARGGWKLMLAVAGFAGTIGAGLSKFVVFFSQR